jgi:pimeloyl-ACP methyl ester carboxylesterase
MPSGRPSRRNWRPRVRVAIAVAGVGALLAAVTGCSGLLSTSSGPDGSNYKGITIESLRPKDSATLQSYYNQKPDWQPCSGGLLCATIKTPVDWQHVTRSSIELALVKHPASGTSIGTLVVNPGGPGGSGVDFVKSGVTNVVDSNVAAHYDIVGFDPRGVGESSPVTCFNDAGMDNYLYGRVPGVIGSVRWISAEEKRARSLAAACEKGTGPVLAHIDSVSAASDLDLIRSALGETKLNYLGYSYGTYLGTLYAGLYPQNVGRMVLDGADDPWGADYQPAPDGVPAEDYSVSPQHDPAVAQAQGFEDDFNAYLQACIAGTKSAVGSQSCPFSGGVSSADTSVKKLLAAADSKPLADKDGRHLYAAILVTAITDSLYSPEAWPELTQMFVQLKAGNPTIAFEFADQYNDRDSNGTYHDNLDLAHQAIECLEGGPSTDIPFDFRELLELERVAPVLGEYSAYGDLPCSGWKYGPTPFPNPVRAKGTGPILVLGTTGDPATPYADAQLLAKQLEGGHLVTYVAEGHTAYNRGDTCINGTVDAYLVSGTVPAKDPRCH